MAENLQKRPAKGILKNSSSFDKQESQPIAKKSKETKWDEMNIIATLHPPDKDYGHMKIDEPKTPFNYVDSDNVDGLDATELAEKIRIEADKPPKVLEPDSDEESDDDLTEEDKIKKKEFALKRKKHYNEYYAIQLAKKLMEEDEDDDDDIRGSSLLLFDDQRGSENYSNSNVSTNSNPSSSRTFTKK